MVKEGFFDIPKPDDINMKNLSWANKSFLDLLSTHFLICNEKISEKGEDSGYEAFTTKAGVVGVFDGCGGLGSKVCSRISGKTEAYLASRAVCNAVRLWFYENVETGYGFEVETLKNKILENLSICQGQNDDGGLRLKGSLVRPFPSTVAMVAFKPKGAGIVSQHIWAGDSRTYVIDKDGLAQISKDDAKGGDAMANLSRDGALTNVISVDGRFVLHEIMLLINSPCIVLAATDGCFSYVTSPMEFEYIILSTLINSSNVNEWRKKLNQEISTRAGDDQTIAVASFGFDCFEDMKKFFRPQLDKVTKIVEEVDSSDEEKKNQLWKTYKPNYYRYQADGFGEKNA